MLHLLYMLLPWYTPYSWKMQLPLCMQAANSSGHSNLNPSATKFQRSLQLVSSSDVAWSSELSDASELALFPAGPEVQPELDVNSASSSCASMPPVTAGNNITEGRQVNMLSYCSLANVQSMLDLMERRLASFCVCHIGFDTSMDTTLDPGISCGPTGCAGSWQATTFCLA